MNEILFRGGMRLVQIWEVAANICVLMLILAISPIIIGLFMCMMVIGAIDYMVMGRRV